MPVIALIIFVSTMIVGGFVLDVAIEFIIIIIIIFIIIFVITVIIVMITFSASTASIFLVCYNIIVWSF